MISLYIDKILNYPDNLQFEIIRYFVNKFSDSSNSIESYSTLSHCHLTSIVDFIKKSKTGSILDNLPGNLLLRKDYNLLMLTGKEDKQEKSYECIEINSIDEFPLSFGEISFSVIYCGQCRNNDIAYNRKNSESFDLAQMKFPLRLKSIKNGDKFVPLGMNGKMMVSDFFTNNKISYYDRHKSCVLEDCEGNILWLIPLRISEYARINDNTEEIVTIQTGVF
ncbi:MAG: tRNA lysidine(34) synthetase TilS [Planctomycetota bacterium]